MAPTIQDLPEKALHDFLTGRIVRVKVSNCYFYGEWQGNVDGDESKVCIGGWAPSTERYSLPYITRVSDIDTITVLN